MADPSEVTRRFRNEVFVTQVEVTFPASTNSRARLRTPRLFCESRARVRYRPRVFSRSRALGRALRKIARAIRQNKCLCAPRSAYGSRSTHVRSNGRHVLGVRSW